MGSRTMRFGVWLPSFTWEDDTWVSARELREWCIRADHAGVDIWVIDHLLVAPVLYSTSWLEPDGSPSTYAAALTERVQVAPGILVLPVRNPVLLAKEIATLQVLSENRFMLGVGPGWHKQEFDVTGTVASRSGDRRTDELLDAVQALLENRVASYHGKYYQFEDVQLAALHRRRCRTSGWPEARACLIQPTTQTSTTRYGYIHPSVVRRILEVEALALALLGHAGVGDPGLESSSGRRRAKRATTRTSWSSATATSPISRRAKTREEAYAAQREPFLRAMGSRRSFEHLCDCYMLGTNADIIARLEELADAGCTYMVLGPVSAELSQIDMLIDEIVPHFH